MTKTLTVAVPYNLEQQSPAMGFDNAIRGRGRCHLLIPLISTSIPATDPDGTVNFTPKAEGSWTLAQLTALCPTSTWDTIFASQYDSVITNPPDNPVPDPDYVIPS